jgi:cytidine deaminase
VTAWWRGSGPPLPAFVVARFVTASKGRPRRDSKVAEKHQMTSEELILVARRLAQPFTPSADCTSGEVAAALMTNSGKVYTGICVDAECGLGFCAEHSAIAEMLKAQECEIRMIVAVDYTGTILSPCGRCRELMWQVSPKNREAEILLEHNRRARLADLLPDH